ncbi:MAG TPA: sensor histidine kinase [Candidatus Limnocylindrales bacterium]|nr:sensor histidine kinase [Candidatus Limnocylindrales bacterium]
MAVAVAHTIAESSSLAGNGALEAFLASLLLIPVLFAGYVFGLRGAALTAGWSVLVTLPNLYLWHTGVERVAEFWQAAFVVGVGVLAGYLFDRERRVRRDNEARDDDRRLMVEAFARRMLLAREEERASIARELHDGPLQSAVVLWRMLDPSDASVGDAARTRLRGAQASVERLATELRRFCRDLRPSVLTDLGLAPALRAEAAGFEGRTGIATDFRSSTPEPDRLSDEAGLMLFRVCQEALRNVERHADARNVLVEVKVDDSSVTLRVADDGRGTGRLPSAANLLNQNRFGIVGMTERARAVGGVFRIGARPPSGTTVEVQVPLA